MDVREKVAANIREQGLLWPGGHALVAVSAGVDSVVLATLLASLAKIEGWQLRLVHFNHQLRGAESDADAAFVEALASQLSLPIHHGSGNVAAFAGEKHLSIEMAARELRHRFFAEQAAATGAGNIVLGHHSDDQVELFWLRLLRGSASLAGMRWSNPSPFARATTLVRPLLNISKASLLKYAAENSIAYREDSTNGRTDFERNQLRLELFPSVEKIHPNFRSATLRVAAVLSAEKDYITTIAKSWLDQSSGPFESLHPAIQREVMRLQLVALDAAPTFDLIERLRSTANEPVTVGPHLAIAAIDGHLTSVDQRPVSFSSDRVEIRVDTPGEIEWEGISLSWVPASARDSVGQAEYFDAAKIGPVVTLRHWQPGDRFQPIGLPSPVKLQDLFVNAKIARADRSRKVIAAAAFGEIFWVEGLRIGEPFKVMPDTGTLLKWRWHRTH